jgi:uroporphyrinogen III methyltransferase/synthase
VTVRLVGAGCGGPLWLTLEAKLFLERADHIVYDSLIHPDLLQLAPQECAFHCVGKRGARPGPGQAAINDLLVRLGREGGEVVRLKGGDPFVFGRGGEEAMALAEAGVPWTYTPGITAALGGLARAGIPPTHRGVADSVTLATGHKGGEGGADPDLWRPLGAVGGTKAVYMGASSWPQVASLLREGGMPDDAPCAAVTWGGWGRAFRRDFLLGEDPGVLRSPSVIAAGGTAGMKLEGARGVLAGVQVAVVRPSPESWTTARMLEEHGADAYSLPLLRLEEIRRDGESETLALADWIVLTSPRGAALLPRATDLRRIRARIAVIGEGTRDALLRTGIRADEVADPATSEALASLLSRVVTKGDRVVFFRNEAGSPLPVDAAKERGADVAELDAYRMIPSLPPGSDSLRELWEERAPNAVVFGSAALADAWAALGLDFPEGAVPIAWGEACGRAVERLFGRKASVMDAPSTEGLLRTLLKITQGRECAR